MEKQKSLSGSKNALLQSLLSQVHIDDVVDDWIDGYKDNKQSGVLELIQLLFDAAGHNSVLTEEVIEENPKEVIEHLSATIPGTKQAPIMNKQVHVNIAVFFQKLILKSGGLLFDDFLLDRFFRFLVRVSRNSLRAFRYVGTFVGLKIITALVGVRDFYVKKLLACQDKLFTEKAEEINFLSMDDIEMLQAKIHKLQGREAELTQILNDYLLKLIFKQRIVDKMPEIQAICLSEAVSWMQIYPKTFMDNDYLKYYKWLMTSSSSSVRQAVLKALLFLFETQTLNHKLEIFVSDNIVNIVNRTLDKSLSVSVMALKLLTEIMKVCGSKIMEGQNQTIFYLVFSKHKNIATEAGVFLLTWLKVQTNKAPSNMRMLTCLTQFFEQARLPNHASYMVEALFPNCHALEDWEAMCFVLIRETKNMTADQETCFLKIMIAAIEQACSGKFPRSQDAKQSSRKILKLRNEHKSKITECFAERLPQLLHKYRENADKTVMLLQVAKFLELDQMPSTEQTLNTLVKGLENLIEIHSNHRIIRGCCDVMEYFISQQRTTHKPEHIQKWTIQDNLLKKFIQVAEAIQKCAQVNTLPTNDKIFTLVSTLEKLVIMYEYKDQKWEELWSICLNFIAHFHGNLPVAFIEDCIKICHLIILWARLRIEKAPRIDDDEISLQSKLLQLLFVLQRLLTHEIQDFQKSAFFVICDMLLVFCENGERNFPNLGLSADESLRSLLRVYVENTVFLDDNEKDSIDLEFGKSVLTAYSKLVSYGMLKIESGVWIFWYFKKNDKAYSAILKKTFKNMLESDDAGSGEALMNMLLCSFRVLLERGIKNMESVKKIMREKFMNFSHLLAASPQALFCFHRQGLLFAYEKGTSSRDNRIILEILSDFMDKLIPEHASILHEEVKQLEKHTLDKSSSAAKYQITSFRKSKSVSLKRKRNISNHWNKHQAVARRLFTEDEMSESVNV